MTAFNTTIFDTPPVKFTEEAIKEVKQLRYEKDVPQDHILRIGVKGGGCAGLSYILGFDKKKDSDDEFLIEGIPMIMEKSHGMYLLGMEIDYVNGLNNRGFIFKNPNAASTCGCGTSFSA